MTQILSKSRERIVWLDVVRLIAIFMVLAIHCTDNVTPVERSLPWYHLWGSIYGSLMRPSIPLFVMITGLLLLPVKVEINKFYKKRIVRVLIPFFVWGVIYNLFPWFTGVLGIEAGTVQSFFAWAGKSPSQELIPAFQRILLLPFNFSVYTTHLWYVYVVIGIYLYLPIFSAWVEKASKRNMEAYFYIWGITLLIPYLNEYLSDNLFGTCSWNHFGMFYAFAGFNGYLLLGHYLYRYNKLNWKNTLLIAIPFFVIGYLVTFKGFRTIVSDPSSTENQVELFYTYCSLNVAMMAVAVFMIVQKIKIKSTLAKKILADFTKCGFGIYMSHYLFLGPCYDLIDGLAIHTMAKMVISSFLLLFVTWTFVSLFYRATPKMKWIFG